MKTGLRELLDAATALLLEAITSPTWVVCPDFKAKYLVSDGYDYGSFCVSFSVAGRHRQDRGQGGIKMIKINAKFIALAFCFSAITAFNGSAIADAELYTPPITDPPDAGLLTTCSIVNVSDKSRTVTIEVREGGQGAAHSTTNYIPPGGGMFLDFPAACTDGCTIYCKFFVQGNKHEYRASICDDNLGCLSAE